MDTEMQEIMIEELKKWRNHLEKITFVSNLATIALYRFANTVIIHLLD